MINYLKTKAELLFWLVFITFLLFLWLYHTGCYNPKLEKDYQAGREYVRGVKMGKPAKNKPVFISRADYHTKLEFQKALCRKIAWLVSKGYKIVLVKPVYGQDMTQREIIKYYIIYFRRVKE